MQSNETDETMNRYLLLFIFLLSLSTSFVYAQKEKIEYLPNFDKKKIHFGYYIGINRNSFEINYHDQSGQDLNSPVNPIPPDGNQLFVDVEASLGFNIGFVVDYRLHQNINLRFEPGLMSNAKTITFVDPYLDASVNGIPIYNNSTRNLEREVAGTYLHLPLLLKFSTNRMNNMRPYVIGGVSYDYNFSSNQKNGKDNFESEFRMTSNNFMYEVGIGVDFYMYFFKFTPSIRGVFAINNELVNDHNPVDYPEYSSPWTGPIDFMGTRGVYLNLTFE
jgi:hypothetical protein